MGCRRLQGDHGHHSHSAEPLVPHGSQAPDRRPFKYHRSQQEAIETLVFVWEFEKVRTRKGLLDRYAQRPARCAPAALDDFARYCIKMATGSGKTKVMSLAIAWQYFNAVREPDEVAKDYAKTFLLLAPNVIVLERLKTDFAGGRIFRADPVIPRELAIFWEFDCVMRGEAEKAPAEGMLFLTNIQQFYDRADRNARCGTGCHDGGTGLEAPDQEARTDRLR